MAFVTHSNRLQPLWQHSPTAWLTASGTAFEVPSLPIHPWVLGCNDVKYEVLLVRGVRGQEEKKGVPEQRVAHMFNHGWWRLVVGGWQLAVGGGCWLVIGGWWRLVVVGGWRLVAATGWRLAVVGGWRLVAVGGWRLVVWGSP